MIVLQFHPVRPFYWLQPTLLKVCRWMVLNVHFIPCNIIHSQKSRALSLHLKLCSYGFIPEAEPCNVVPTARPVFLFGKWVNGIEGGENGAGARTACQTINKFPVFLPRSSLFGLNSVVFDLSRFWRLSFTLRLSAYMLMRWGGIL